MRRPAIAPTREKLAANADEPTPWMDWMRDHIGEVQQTGSKPSPFTIEIFEHTTYPKLRDFTPESCAATVCAALEETGFKSTHSAAAISYATYGSECDLKPGCIIVFNWPGGGHHVTFCDQIVDNDTVRCLGGNQGHALEDAVFSRQYIVATRWPVQGAASLTAALPKPPRTSELRLGKRHARHDPRVPKLASYIPLLDLPAPPDQVDWYSRISTWGMMGNDTIGDCTCAAIGHVILQWTTYASSPRLLSDDDVLSLYEAVGGYNPQDPATDQGAVETDVLNYWLNTGVKDDKLAGYASMEVGNLAEIKDAIHWFGNAYVGLLLPVSAKTQAVWAVPPGGATGEGAPGSWGGHAVPIVGYDARGLYCVTWGAIKRLTFEFWTTYCDEAYALLSHDFVNAAGTTPDLISWDALEADMHLLKGGFQSAKSIRHI